MSDHSEAPAVRESDRELAAGIAGKIGLIINRHMEHDPRAGHEHGPILGCLPTIAVEVGDAWLRSDSLAAFIAAARERDRQVMAEMYQQQNERDMERAEAAETKVKELEEKNAALLRGAHRIRCPEHAMDASNAWGCPGCVASLRDSLAALRPLLLEAAEMIQGKVSNPQGIVAVLVARLRKAAEEEEK